jgi:hypothetical protein
MDLIKKALILILRGLLDKIISDVQRLLSTLLRPLLQLLRINLLNQTLDDLNNFVLSVNEGAALGQIPNSFNDPANPAGNVAGELFARAQTEAFSVKLTQ